MSLSTYKLTSALWSWSAQLMISGYSPSWEKLNLVPEGEVTLEPEEKGELAAVSCRPPAEWDRNHSFASSCVRSWEVGVYLDRQTSCDELWTTLMEMNSVELTMNIYSKMMFKKKKKSDHYTPETYEVSQNFFFFFCYLAAFGENCNSFQFGGTT